MSHAVEVAPFQIKEVQTYNGHEFTNALNDQKRRKDSRIELTLKNWEFVFDALVWALKNTTDKWNANMNWKRNVFRSINI